MMSLDVIREEEDDGVDGDAAGGLLARLPCSVCTWFSSTATCCPRSLTCCSSTLQHRNNVILARELSCNVLCRL